MNEKYSGLCVGGPYNGRMMDSSIPVVKVIAGPAFPLGYIDAVTMEPAMSKPVDVVEYRHVGVIGPFTVALWVPRDFDSAWAFAEIIRQFALTGTDVSLYAEMDLSAVASSLKADSSRPFRLSAVYDGNSFTGVALHYL